MKIFISHSSKDNHVVFRILKMLSDERIDHWVDIKQLDVEIGPEINRTINREILECDHFLLIWSKNAQKSKYVETEVVGATSPDYDGRLKKIIIKLDNTPLPFNLSDRKRYQIKNDDVEDIMQEIITKISSKNLENTEDEISYDDYLDETYGKVKVVNQEYSTSEVLKAIDSIRYDEIKQIWENRNERTE